ncbi:MAG: hypothetical protein NUW37_03295 [Planctomycetes bacterium]|nr:hypothetical protein [Planctomycetota bacterium]
MEKSDIENPNPPVQRKQYVRPEVKTEQLFEHLALGCAKTGVSDVCVSSPFLPQSAS